MGFFQNTCKPKGLGGMLMLTGMNKGHAPMADWGFQHLQLKPEDHVLDIGCGGGANVKKLLSKCPQGQVTGVDYSPLSVSRTIRENREAVDQGRCIVKEEDAGILNFPQGSFDVVTAFETVYFWPNLLHCFQNVRRVLKDDGVFMICNESNGENKKDEKWTKIISGMVLYSALHLETVLHMAGFAHVTVDKNKNGWLCVTAEKTAPSQK